MAKSNVVSIVVALVLIGGAIAYLESGRPRPIPRGDVTSVNAVGNEEKAKRFSVAKEITTPDGFINTDGKPVTIGEFIGKKVVLLDIWTYSCINCQRTTPYLNAWYKKYKDKGLEIIGLHTPEFEFEKDYQNVLAATKSMGIKYPVVLDNDYSTWNAYENRFWPRKYLIDIDGYVVYDHIGEGAYEETEQKIQELLEERMTRLNLQEEIAKDTYRPTDTIATDFSKPRSPEIYFGAARNERLGNGEAGKSGIQNLAAPASVKANTLYLAGEWDFRGEFAENINGSSPSTGSTSSPQASSGPWKIIFRYQGKTVYFVAGASDTVSIKILRDGAPIGKARGKDVGDGSTVTVKEERLYTIVDDPTGYGEHTLELIIENPGLQAFTFTFG